LLVRGRWFAGWIVVGAVGALTAIGAASIGLAFAPLFLIALFFISRRTRYALDRLGFGTAGYVSLRAISCLRPCRRATK